jgi:hypothetical protein
MAAAVKSCIAQTQTADADLPAQRDLSFANASSRLVRILPHRQIAGKPDTSTYQ